MSVRRLILVDGTAAMYRAFYAVRELTTAEGRPTNAVFGFIRLLRQLQRTLAPTHLIVVFDGGLPEERIRIHKAYKAQRDPMPGDLAGQFEVVEEYLDKARICWLRMDGQEADDVLASFADQAEKGGAEVRIHTNDKDLYQLVGGPVRLLRPSDGNAEMDEAAVFEKTGVYPDRIVEWLALMGDSSDNIDGVPGVGAKTAAKLLGRYGSLAAVWEHIETVTPPRIQEALESARETIARNLELIRLRRDLDCVLDWDAATVSLEEPDRLGSFFETYELHSLARDVKKA